MVSRMTADAPRLHTGDLVRIRDERWRTIRHLPYGTAAIIDVEGCEDANRGVRARFLLPVERFDRLPVSGVPRVVRPGRWRHVARRALTDAFPPWTSLRAATRANLTLFAFQLEPALALVRGDGCRFLIADAVGMGKTVQAALMIAEVLQRRAEARALVVCPAGLRDQWRDELRTRFGLAAEVLDAESIARTDARLPASVNPWSVHPLAITSIDYVKRPEVMRCLETLIWDVIVFDEAHGLAGRSDRGAAASALGSRARILVLLTATPHAGDDEAFCRLCGIGDIKDGDSLLWFRRTRTDVGMSRRRRTVLLRIRPTPAEAAMHQALLEYGRLIWTQSSSTGSSAARLAMSVLMRRACSSATSLARSVERRMALLSGPAPALVQPVLPFADGGDDDEPGAVLGAAGLHDPLEEYVRLERILNLAREAAETESKLAALRRLVARTLEPAIVFTEYRDTLQTLAAALEHVETVQLHGGLRSSERVAALRRFTGGSARLLLATDAASEGLNLHQRCRLVVNLELPWTPLRLEQRAGRIDRIGQPHAVHALHLVAAQTGEEEVLAKLTRRISRMQHVLSAVARLPDEAQIAECVVAGQTLPELPASAFLPGLAGIRTPDLAREARAEAARIAAERALIGASRGSGSDDRPVMTRLRRRRARATGSRCYWLFRLLFAGTDGRVLWESVLPLGADGTGIRARSNARTRALLDPQHAAVQQIAARAQERQLQQLQQAVCGPAHLWARREAALEAGLRGCHARLSAGLLQLALFDRRDERATAAQSALLEAALSYSAARMAELAGYEELHLESSELVFAVAFE